MALKHSVTVRESSAHEHAYTQNTQTHKHTNTHAYTHAHTYTHIHTHTHTYTHTYIEDFYLLGNGFKHSVRET